MIPAGLCLYDFMWPYTSWWCCGPITSCLKANWYVLFIFMFFCFSPYQSEMGVIFVWSWWLISLGFCMPQMINGFRPLHFILPELCVFVCQHYFVQLSSLLWLLYGDVESCTYPAVKDRFCLTSWQNDGSAFPSKTTFVYYFPLDKPRDPLPPPAEKKKKQQVSSAVIFGRLFSLQT